MARIANRITGTLDERCRQAAEAKRGQAMKLAAGPDREKLLREAQQLETTSKMESWLASLGPKPLN